MGSKVIVGMKMDKLADAFLAFVFKGWIPGIALCLVFSAFTSAKAAEGGPPFTLIWKTVLAMLLASVFCLVFGWAIRWKER